MELKRILAGAWRSKSTRGKPCLPILHADAPPDMTLLCSKAKFAFKQTLQTIRPLGQNLISVPVSSRHHAGNRDNIIIRHVLVEKVAHRVDENHPGSSPAQWVAELFRNDSQIETKFKRMVGHATKPFSESLRVAMQTAGADLRASANGIPSCICPFNFRFVAHLPITRLRYFLKICSAIL